MTEANAAAFAGEVSESSVPGFDVEVDVLVVGTGAGDMTAALKAHDEGAACW